jgi:DNA-binding transcriptional MerR regulator
MRIGQVASLGGVLPATLRYYERRGLLTRPTRTSSGYRAYSDEAVAQLRLIQWAKGLGFTLREIKEMTRAVGQHAEGQGHRVRSQVAAKIREVDAKMQQLALIRQQLTEIARCRCNGHCPVVADVLAGKTSHKAKEPE